MAELTRQKLPCIVTANDTISRTDTLYDLIEVQCPDTIAYRTDTFETSYAVRVPVYIKTQVPRIRETITHTIRIKDSADTYLANYALNEANKKAERLQDKVQVRNKFLTWLIIALLVSLFFNFRKPIILIVQKLIRPI